MTLSAGELAHWLGAELIGDADVVLRRAARMEDAGPDALCFLANPQYRASALTCPAGALLLSQDETRSGWSASALLFVPDPYTAFTRVLERLEQARAPRPAGRSPLAWVHEQARVDPTAWIGPYACIDEGCTIGPGVQIHPLVSLGRHVAVGEGSVLYPGVVVYDDCIIGPNCVLHAGAVLGSDGFGFAPQPDGSYRKIPQLGNVVLGAGVEVGANSTIDRATLGSTLLQTGVKLDNLVQVAHNAEIGEYSVLAAQSGVSGSTRIGRGVQLGGQAGLVGHIRIADGVRINAQSGVNRSVEEPGSALTGSPAGPYRAELRAQVLYRQLPELESRLRALEARLAALAAQKS
jgi:UDP-3-O-[3-hydroxymyristoyl] glucosamine N-acyltransferase